MQEIDLDQIHLGENRNGARRIKAQTMIIITGLQVKDIYMRIPHYNLLPSTDLQDHLQ